MAVSEDGPRCAGVAREPWCADRSGSGREAGEQPQRGSCCLPRTGASQKLFLPGTGWPPPCSPTYKPPKSEPGSSVFCCLLTADSSFQPGPHPHLLRGQTDASIWDAPGCDSWNRPHTPSPPWPTHSTCPHHNHWFLAFSDFFLRNVEVVPNTCGSANTTEEASQ